MRDSPVNLVADLDSLVCPRTKQTLRLATREEARRQIAGGSPLATRRPGGVEPVGETEWLLVREDRLRAYAIVDGVPVLLAPEMLMPTEDAESFDLSDRRYAEAYQEMEFYNDVATRSAADVLESRVYRLIAPILSSSSKERRSFPEPRSLWIDAVYDAAAQWDAYEAIAPVEGKVVLQLGGGGIHAVKFLLAGAKQSWLVTPMLGEIQYARALARAAGVETGLRAVASVAEELPLAGRLFDAIYAGGCVHHMVTELAFPETARVLRPGGLLVAAEPWRAPFYGLGTKLFGKREKDVFCRPLTDERLQPFFRSFSSARVIRHGTITRYPMLAANRLGLQISLGVAWGINRIDDALCSAIPGFRRFGSSIALIGKV